MVETFRCKILDYFISEGIATDGAYHTARQPELRHMICKVGRCATYFLTFGEYVPQGLAHAYDYVIHYFKVLELNFSNF